MKQVFRVMLMATALAVMMTGAAHAQANGSIFGKVVDTSGGVLPGVTVTVTGPTLQQPLVQVTTGTGAYQFPVVPIGTFTVTFELSGFKKASRANIVLTSGFNAPVNMTMQVGQMTEELTVSAAAPVVDTKKTTSGATFTSDVLEKIPSARDPWQIINMTPGVQAGLNVGGSSSGQQVGLQSRGTGSSVQWNLEGGSITDMSSNSSPSYFNFDSFEQISVTNGGGDVSVQSSGLSINLVTKSGSNVFKGSAVGTFQNDKMQGNNVSEDQFNHGTTGFLSGAPIKQIYNMSVEYGGPILKNRLWFWAAADKQSINVGVVNYFDRGKSECVAYADAQKTGSLLGTISYADIGKVQDCLASDLTLIKNLQGKINYQLNAAHKFQFQLISDNKTRNARDASDSTEKEATSQQTSDKKWGLASPQLQLAYTWIASDRLVFNTIATKVYGGFYLDYQDIYTSCGLSKYTGAETIAGYPQASDPNCMFNIQQLDIRTTGNLSRSKSSTYQTVRPSFEVKTDGTYFLTNVLGGDHSLKFGAGYRHNPVLTYSHYSGGARASVQCMGNSLNNCGDGYTFVAPGAATGLTAYRARLYRDRLTNYSWWTYNGYIQDSYSYKRLRVNAGLRYDWQQSKHLGGCVPANEIRPDLLPAQCEDPATGGISAVTGEYEELPSFGNFAPRVSLTYDLFGDGKTALKASGSFYYQSKITLAGNLSGLGAVAITFGTNNSNGTCRGTSCWQDLNLDGFVQANELTGTPSTSSSRFNIDTGVYTPAGNSVDKSTKIARTREFTVGATHELIPNLAVGVDYIFRRYDQGTQSFTIGYQPGAPGFPLSSIYTGPLTYTDAVTGKSANYYVVKDGVMRPSGLGSITMTAVDWSTYQGVDLTLNKRYSDRWQLNIALTVQKRIDAYPPGSYTNPTGFEYYDGTNVGARYLFKLNGSYDLPYGIMLATNLNINDGASRFMEIYGPGPVYNGVNSSGATTTTNWNTLNFERDGSTRLERTMLWDMGLNKTFTFRGGQNRVKLTLDGFNILNTSPILRYYSNNLSLLGSTSNPIPPSERISSLLPPRVFRVGATFWF